MRAYSDYILCTLAIRWIHSPFGSCNNARAPSLSFTRITYVCYFVHCSLLGFHRFRFHHEDLWAVVRFEWWSAAVVHITRAKRAIAANVLRRNKCIPLKNVWKGKSPPEKITYTRHPYEKGFLFSDVHPRMTPLVLNLLSAGGLAWCPQGYYVLFEWFFFCIHMPFLENTNNALFLMIKDSVRFFIIYSCNFNNTILSTTSAFRTSLKTYLVQRSAYVWYSIEIFHGTPTRILFVLFFISKRRGCRKV